MNNFNLFNQSFATRPPEKEILTVPLHEKVDKAESEPILAKAAKQIATSGLVWRWVSYDRAAKPKLVRWDHAERVFLRGALFDWQVFFGNRWSVRDTNNQEFRGPSPVVTDRLLQAILAHPDIPVASWSLQSAKQREAK